MNSRSACDFLILAIFAGSGPVQAAQTSVPVAPLTKPAAAATPTAATGPTSGTASATSTAATGPPTGTAAAKPSAPTRAPPVKARAQKPVVVSNYNLRSHQRNVQQPPLQRQPPPRQRLLHPHLMSQQQLHPTGQQLQPGQQQTGQQLQPGQQQPGQLQQPGQQQPWQQLQPGQQQPGQQLQPGQPLQSGYQQQPVYLQPSGMQQPLRVSQEQASRAQMQRNLVPPRPKEQQPQEVSGLQRNVVHLVGSNPVVVSRSFSTPTLLQATGSSLVTF